LVTKHDKIYSGVGGGHFSSNITMKKILDTGYGGQP